MPSYYGKKLSQGRSDGRGGLSARSVLYHHRVLSEALRHAVRMGVLVRNVADLSNLLNETSLAERESLVRSFIKEVKVTGDDVLMTYTMPMLPAGVTEEKLPVLSIVHSGGR